MDHRIAKILAQHIDDTYGAQLLKWLPYDQDAARIGSKMENHYIESKMKLYRFVINAFITEDRKKAATDQFLM